MRYRAEVDASDFNGQTPLFQAGLGVGGLGFGA